jgi:hypothetical protein
MTCDLRHQRGDFSLPPRFPQLKKQTIQTRVLGRGPGSDPACERQHGDQDKTKHAAQPMGDTRRNEDAVFRTVQGA